MIFTADGKLTAINHISNVDLYTCWKASGYTSEPLSNRFLKPVSWLTYSDVNN